MARDHIHRIVMSADRKTRMIATSNGFWVITEHYETPYDTHPFSTDYFPTGGTPHYMGSRTLAEAYETVKSGNMGVFRGNQWVNRTVRRFATM